MDIYYDDGCGFCVRAMRLGRRMDFFHRVSFHPLSGLDRTLEPWNRIPPEAMLRDIHGADRSGRIYQGIALYRAALSAMVWTRPFAWLLYLPGIYHLANLIYRRIADGRNRNGCAVDSGAARLHSHSRPNPSDSSR